MLFFFLFSGFGADVGPTVVPLSRLAGPKGKDSFKKGEWQEH